MERGESLGVENVPRNASSERGELLLRTSGTRHVTSMRRFTRMALAALRPHAPGMPHRIDVVQRADADRAGADGRCGASRQARHENNCRSRAGRFRWITVVRVAAGGDALTCSLSRSAVSPISRVRGTGWPPGKKNAGKLSPQRATMRSYGFAPKRKAKLTSAKRFINSAMVSDTRLAAETDTSREKVSSNLSSR